MATTAVASPTLRAQIDAAVAAGDAQHYVKIVSFNTAPGQSQTITSLAGPGMGTQFLSTGVSGGSNHMTVEYVNHALYVKASLGFLEGTFGLSPGVATSVIDKWVLVPTSSSAFRNVFAAVTITSAMSFVATAGPVTSGRSTTLAGVKVKVFRVAMVKSSASPAGTETLYVALAGPPLPVEVDFVGGGYTSKMRFSQWGKRFTLHPPATSLTMP
ncbi:MAG: hypothetical protein ACHQFZ_02770 [Acidimicrobiales bacterium]